jgi:hypothetical protein
MLMNATRDYQNNLGEIFTINICTLFTFLWCKKKLNGRNAVKTLRL